MAILSGFPSGAVDKSMGLTASANDLARGKTALVDGKVIVGTMGTLIGSLAVGSIVKLNEGGREVEFYVATHDYEKELNGAGRTLLVRKNCYGNDEWNNASENEYRSSYINVWLNNTYKNLFDTNIRRAMGTTEFYYTRGAGDFYVSTMQESVFLLSMKELGQTDSSANEEGATLPIAVTLKVAHLNGSANTQWTRSADISSIDSAWGIGTDGKGTLEYYYSKLGIRPVFTLPATSVMLPDGTVVV